MAQGRGAPACLSLVLLFLLLPGATRATPYSSLCPAAGRGSRTTQTALPEISSGHFSGGEDLHFAPDQSYTPRSFSLDVRRSANATTTDDPAVPQVFATLTLVGTRGRRNARPHSVSFYLEGHYYSTADSSAELCMVGSGSYARDDGFAGVVTLSDVVLRLRVPRPSNLSRPFVTGRLEGARFGAVTLVAYAESDYEYGDPASCPVPPPARGYKSLKCRRLKSLLRGFYYGLEYGGPGDAPLRMRHQRMQFNQIRCAGNGVLRAYLAFDTFNASYSRRLSNYTSGWRPGLLVGDEALVAEGYWSASTSQFCMRACRVVRSGADDLAVRECDVGIGIWFPTVWSIRDRSAAAGTIWNTSDKSSAVISVSRSASYRDDLSYVRYNYTRVQEATKHYLLSKPAASRKGGTFPGGNDSYQDFAFNFLLKSPGFYGYASPVAIGSVLAQGDRLMAEDAFYNNWTSLSSSERMKTRRLLNISYDLQYHAWYDLNSSSANNISQQWMSRQRRISAEGVYDAETGFLCMVGCQAINGNGSKITDCKVLVTAQFAPVDVTGDAREDRVVGAISSLSERGDHLFFEALEMVAEGAMYTAEIAESVSRIDAEGFMVVVSMTLSCVFTGLQLRHVKRHPEALPATSVTMLVVLAVGYAVPLMLNLEAVLADSYRDSRRKHFVQLTSAGGLLELNEFMLRVSSMLAFVLQLRLLQLVVASRQPAPAGGGKQSAEEEYSSSDAERSTLWVCLPLYLLGAVLVWIAHKSDGYMPDRWNRAGGAAAGNVVDDLAAYAGLVLDGFLLPQVVRNAFAGSGRAVRALSLWFYAGGSLVRAAPHLYDVFRRRSYYAPSWAEASYVYAGPRDDLFGAAWDVAVPCGAALLAVLLFLQQRLGGAFLCGGRPRGYQMVSRLSS